MKDEEMQIVDLLRRELPSNLLQKADEIEILILKEKYREAYLNMYELKKSNLWTPTSQYLELIEKFWWNYAN